MKSVFVSSTFRDMNFERDVLNRNVSPKINYFLSACNESIRILDLRWGVDTSDMSEQEASERVLTACFDAIDNCLPYIVVLLGDRYGYIPNGSSISVTHMEILRGVLDRVERDHVFIYLRDADYAGIPEEARGVYIESDEASRDRLLRLKGELLEKLPDRCKRYAAHWSEEKGCLVSEDFEAMIVEDLKEDLVDETRNSRFRSDLHMQIHENEQTMAENLRYAYSNADKLAAEIGRIQQTEHPYAIIGEGGTGKSVYTSLLCSALREKGDRAYVFFCGSNAFSSSVRNVAEMILYIFSEESGQPYDFEANAALGYDELISRIAEARGSVRGKTCLLLDAVDKCDEGMLNFIYWCDSFLRGQIRIVFSSRMNGEISERAESMEVSEMTYTRADFKSMAACILNRYAKSISDEHIELLLDKTATPLQLQLLLLRLLNLNSVDYAAIQKAGGGMEAINAYLRGMIEESPSTVEDLVISYLDSLLKERERPLFAVYLLNMLTYFEHGVQEDDLRAMLELGGQPWVELDYVDFLQHFDFFIRIRDNGRLDVSHDIIRRSLAAHLEKSRSVICFLASTYLLNRENPDANTIRSFFDVVYAGQQYKVLHEFLQKYQASFTIADASGMALAAEIRKGIQGLFVKDEGMLFFRAVTCCRSADELAHMQMILSTALLSMNNYYSEELIVKIAYAIMVMPLQLEFFAGKLFEMEVYACVNFLKRHNVSEEAVEEFVTYCKENAPGKDGGADGKPDETGGQTDEFRELHEASPVDKAIVWMRMAQEARALAQEKATAHQAERILDELLRVLDDREMDMDDGWYDVLYGDLYTSYGVVYKTLKEWEKGLRYDELSLEIYERIYAQNPSPEIFNKYRARVYNIANITEAWAIEEKDNLELWEKTKQGYEKIYAMELAAVSHGMEERSILHTASTICSLGTALIHTGDHDGGMAKYREGIAMMMDSAKNNADSVLRSETSIHLMECASQLLICGKRQAAYDLSLEIGTYLEYVVNSGVSELIDQLQEVISGFSNLLNDLIRQFHNDQDLEGQLIASRILLGVYRVVLPVTPHAVKVNIIMTMGNIGAILFWNLQDYEQAYAEYQEMLRYAVEKDLAVPDENGTYYDEANSRLIDAYVRSILCLEKLDRIEEAQSLVMQANEWAAYLSQRLEYHMNDIPMILFDMSRVLAKNGSQFTILFLMLAFNAANEIEGYMNEHPEEFMMLYELLSKLQSGDDGDGGGE